MQRCYIKVKKNLIKSQIKPSKILVKTERKVHNSFVIFDVVLNTLHTLCLRVECTKEMLDRFNQFKYFNTQIHRQTVQVLKAFLSSRIVKFSWWGRGRGEVKVRPRAAQMRLGNKRRVRGSHHDAHVTPGGRLTGHQLLLSGHQTKHLDTIIIMGIIYRSSVTDCDHEYSSLRKQQESIRQRQ